MKYQVNVDYYWQGEFSVEAESEEEAIEIVKDETFSDPWTNADGNHQLVVNEVYEWDEEAQERNKEEVKKYFDNLPSTEKEFTEELKVEQGKRERLYQDYCSEKEYSEKLEAENKRLREALEFYAEYNNWDLENNTLHPRIHESDFEVRTVDSYDEHEMRDEKVLEGWGGKRAREALK